MATFLLGCLNLMWFGLLVDLNKCHVSNQNSGVNAWLEGSARHGTLQGTAKLHNYKRLKHTGWKYNAGESLDIILLFRNSH